MSAMPVSKSEVLQDVLGRFDAIALLLEPIPKDDISNVIAGSEMAYGPFNT